MEVKKEEGKEGGGGWVGGKERKGGREEGVLGRSTRVFIDRQQHQPDDETKKRAQGTASPQHTNQTKTKKKIDKDKPPDPLIASSLQFVCVFFRASRRTVLVYAFTLCSAQ